MNISKSTQLGLMFWDRAIMLEYLEDASKTVDAEADFVGVSREVGVDGELKYPKNDGDILIKEISHALGYLPENKGSEFYTTQHPKPLMFLIQPSVDICAEMIKLGDNFSCNIFSKIKDGEYFYLLGKDEFFRFVKFNDVIRGLFWNRSTHSAFEIGFHLKRDQYYFPVTEKAQFNRLVRLMTFIELGDIETIILDKGKNNGKNKKDGKITNTSEFTVYVVDSSWNKLIIRTDGFAVKGHFRLQPCGVNFSERKLIWIGAFEKHGYKRQPRAKIIHEP